MPDLAYKISNNQEVDYPINTVIIAINKLLKYSKNYRLLNYNDHLNHFTIGQYSEKIGFLSQGFFIEIYLLEKLNNITLIKFEISKMNNNLSAVYESKIANEHIDEIINYILNFDSEIPDKLKIKRSYSKDSSLIWMVIMIFLVWLCYYSINYLDLVSKF